jgi:LmbE family N-acetylglucosaminyl deacetylase
MKFLNFNRVFCLSPHPDDVEYSIAGTILKYKDTIFDVLCLSEGGGFDITTSKLRHEEVINSWKLNDSNNYNLYFSDVKFLADKNIDGWISYIESLYTNVNSYDAILCTSEFDSHQEHVIVSSLAAPLSRIKPYSIIQYKSPSTLDTWVPNLFISIDSVYQTKKEMLQLFKSQKDKVYFQDRVVDGYHTNFQCMKKGKGYVEQFKIIIYYE